MDGTLIAAFLVSGVTILTAIGGLGWKLGSSIGRLEGKVDGTITRLDSYNGQIGNLSERIDLLSKHH